MRIAVAMSGGVNSTLAAILMKRVGYEIIGITVDRAYEYPENAGRIFNSDSSLPGNIFSAKGNAKKYNIPHKIFRVEDSFFTETRKFIESNEKKVTDEIRDYAVFTWLLIKKLSEFAGTLGCQRLATGHYARIIRKRNGLFYVAEGLDRSNDESQRLSFLTQDLLAFCMFPLGEYHWGAVEKMIKQNKLGV